MELRQLRYFEAVARLKNFSKAAETLHIAQPPLSRQIKNLEEELGVLLINRESRPLELTNAGRHFYEQAVQILSRLDEMKRTTQYLASKKKQWMGIGFSPSTLYTQIPQLLQGFSRTNPDIDLSLIEQTSIEQVEALKSGRISIGFSRTAPVDKDIDHVVLCQERLVVATATHDPLAHKTSISLEEVSRHKLILYPTKPRPSFADHVLSYFQVQGIEPMLTLESNSLQTAIGLSAAGMGLTIVPESVTIQSREDIRFIPISDQNISTPLIMSTLKGNLGMSLSNLISDIKQAYL